MNARTDARIDCEPVAAGASRHAQPQPGYWIDHLRGAQALVLSIKPRRAPLAAAGLSHTELLLRAEVVQNVRQLAAQTHASAFAVCVAAFKVLLMRWSGQDDVVVGASLMNLRASRRDSSAWAPGARSIVLPLRTDLSGDPGLSRLVQIVQCSLVEAHRRGDAAFDAFAAPPDAGTARRDNPLFIASVHEASDGRACGSDGAASAIELHVGPAAAGLRCTLRARTDLFDEETLHVLAEQYVHLLRQGVERPDAPVSEHCLATAPRQRRLPDLGASLPCVALPDVATQFRGQARRTPDARALQFGDRAWTYRELDTQCRALALRLHSAGARSASVVAIQGLRSPALVAAMTATVSCGAMFVILDPALPKSRREHMLIDSGATLLCHLTANPAGAIDLALDPGCALLRIHPALAGAVTPGDPAQAFEPVSAQPDDPVCLVFTSGSTGKPKPVLASHNGLAHLIQWHAGKFAIEANDKVSLLSSLSFGTLLRDVYLPLTTGATLCIPEESDLLDPLAWCGRRGVSIVHSTPTVLESWLRVLGEEPPRLAIRWVCVAGEPLTDVVVRAWRKRFPSNPGFVNLYGLTETSLAKCFYIVPEQIEPGLQPVGLSLPGTQALVFGPTGVPCGIGERGEIAIRTPYLSLGYLGLGDETRHRFRPNPRRNDPRDLLYFTGDVGHYRADGMLELAGRLDDQVKVRGVRIEPAEVAAALADFPGVAQCVVLARRERSDAPAELIAYIVAESNTHPSAGAMRAHLSTRLPAPMLPRAFVVMQRLPRLPNGKLDKSALPVPSTAALTEIERIAPSTPFEETVWALWSDALNQQDFGVRDNFFDLGGNSLLAMQVLSRLCEKLGVDLTMRTIFDAPTVAELAELAQSIALRAAPGSQMPIARLASERRSGLLPLSAAQRRMYFWEELAPGSSLYNVPVVLELRGRVDAAALQDCLRDLMQRHEILRSRWIASGDTPMQCFDAGTHWGLLRVTLADDPTAPKKQRFDALATREAHTGFDLSRDAPMRATLVTFDAEEHRLLWTLHHSVCDGWSVGILLDELCRLYAARSQGEAPDLPPPELQYADYAAWELAWLDSGIRERELAYWTQQLGGAPGTLELASDRRRPDVQRFRGARVPVSLSPAALNALRGLAQRTETSLFMVVLAAWQLLLHRHSAQSTIVTGTVIANRDRRELGRVVGYFANTLALRADFDDELTVRGLLAQVKATALGAYAHQHVPFEEVVDALKLPRDAGRMPLVQTMVVLQAAAQGERTAGAVRIQRVAPPSPGAKFDLTLELQEQANTLQGSLEYDTDLFDRATVERLLGHWLTLVEGMCADPLRQVVALPLLDEAQRQRILAAGFGPARIDAEFVALHRSVEHHAQHTPHAVAALFERRHLSYAQLNAQANCLAHTLRRLGVGPDVRVGVCMDRSLELVTALLGVLKAGGAFVPMDPELPPDRLEFQLSDTAAPVLLTQSHLVARLPTTGDGALLHVLCLDEATSVLTQGDAGNPLWNITKNDLAYVIYTSGSTGRPKGVLIEHAAMNNSSRWMCDRLAMRPGDRMLAASSISFDASIVELLHPLLAGASVVLPRPGLQRDAPALAAVMSEHEVTLLVMVPPALRALLNEPGFAPGHFRFLVSAGEALDESLARQLQTRFPHTRIGNFYGPTEASIVATHCEWPIDCAGPRQVPIGRPISNAHCLVLDRDLQPVPLGVVGELYIGGAGLARGYLNRPELSAERFISHPFFAGQRLYRSGDLARYRSDANIEFLGRIDSQVKIRGHRIELGEIEAALSAIEGVQQAAVLAREDQPGDKRLVAYVVNRPTSNTACGAAALSERLKRYLPAYMVPAHYVFMLALPLTPSGKLDRNVLPLPGVSVLAEQTRVGPRNPLELAVWQIWSEVLNVAEFGVHDNFFDLGGHSLIATQVISRLRNRLKIEVPLRALFAHPRIDELVAEIQALRGLNEASEHRIGKHSRDAALPLSYSQRRMWLVQQVNPQTCAYNIRVALHLRGRLDVDCLRRALEFVVQRHEAFRTRFTVIDGEPMQIVDDASPLGLKRHDLSNLPTPQRDAHAREIMNAAAAQPFDLSHSGLHRLNLLQLASDEHALFWVIHHVINDQWSNGIVVREVGKAYSQLLRGQQPDLPALPLAYADFAAWQRDPVHQAAIAPQMAYWLERLKGLQPLALPHDIVAHGLPSGRGSSVSARLAPHTFDSLQRLSTQHGATVFMTLLACFKVLLARYCGQTDIAVGSPVANRTRLEFESLVGTMVNTLVHRSDLSGELSFVDLLQRIKESTLEAFANQDAPFERLVEELGVDRGASRAPLVQVLFNVINAPRDRSGWTGITLSSLDYESIAAQFDLGMTVEPGPSGQVHLAYSTDVFVQATAQRFLASYVDLVDQILANPTRRLCDYDLVGRTQRADLAHWNETAVVAAPGLRVDEWIAQSAARHAPKIALRSESGFLSYAELRSRSLRLARHLRALGVGRGALVGLCAERSLDMVVAQLAILRAGAAYVPLDPAYPAERLALMAGDAQLALLVTESPLVHLLDWPDHRRVLLDLDAPAVAARSDDALPPDTALDAGPDDPAYVIYTSGSTGKPKGVIVPHRAVVNFLVSMAREPGLLPTDVLVAVTTLSFDIAVLELLAPLAVGAQVVLASRDQATDGRTLRSLLESHGATILQATPSSWRLLLEAGWRGSPGFRALIGGESLPLDLAGQLLQRCGELWNMYGPTETTVWSTCWRVTQLESGISIGRPIANTQVHVLDANGHVCPIGVVGELHIGGAGVALGYLHRAELTAERFVADPFRPGAKLYRTGDRGRWRHDGLLEHQGRLDHQVKVRGHRIELGEIEAALANHPRVSQAVVIVREDRPGDVRLVAYVTGTGDPEAPNALRDHLRGTLPDYMLPQHYVRLDTMPLLPNGKLDRHALPVPAIDAAYPRSTAEDTPQTPLANAIAEVWRELLGVARVGLHDNFFELGGHSLLAMRAVHEIEKRTHMTLTLRRLIFESLGQLSNSESLEARPPPVSKAQAKGSKFARFIRALAELRLK